MELLGITAAILVYGALALHSAGFLARNELVLRLLMLGALILTFVFLAAFGTIPSGIAMLGTALLIVLNTVMIAIIVKERTTIGMKPELALLSKHFEMISPGQFRQLFKIGRHAISGQDTVLTTAGSSTKRLYYVISGAAVLEKDGLSFDMHPQQFVGEIGFLTGEPASGTVVLKPGSEYLSWEADQLHALFEDVPTLRAAMFAQLNLDLVQKVAKGVPLSTVKPTG